ncbi:MAG: TIGR00266 family protein, partial [Anaerolineae bacterium]|nr:TIGR00266 family protein [Anaerolineae bacterium]
VAGESFFQNTYTAPGQGGELTVAPSLPGDMRVLEVSGNEFLLRSGGYVASEMSVQFDSKWGGSKGFFGGGGLILLKVSGRGKFVVASYGAIEERVLSAGQVYTVDTGHIVGFDTSIGFQVRKAGSWKSTLLGGEGLVCELTGPGRVLMQSRSEDAFLSWLLPKIPSKS